MAEYSTTREKRAMILAAVRDRDRSGCWTDGGFQISPYGYPLLRHGREKVGHVAMVADGRPRPTGAIMCHSCDVRACWNPAHLRWCSLPDNIGDMVDRGRQPRGEGHGRAKLTEAVVLELRARAAAGESYVALAEAFGVTEATVRRAVIGITWRHL